MRKWEYLTIGWHQGDFFIWPTSRQLTTNDLAYLNRVKGIRIDQKTDRHGGLKVKRNTKENPCWQADLYEVLGSEGWELCATLVAAGSMWTFKRPLALEPES